MNIHVILTLLISLRYFTHYSSRNIDVEVIFIHPVFTTFATEAMWQIIMKR